MLATLKWPVLIFLRYYRNLGLRVSLYVLMSLLIVVVNPIAEGFLSEELRSSVDAISVLKVLTILASSMLAVSTFSLSIMITAHRSASAATTPRVHRMLLDDTTTQKTLAAFIGAFVYSLSSVVLFESGVFGDDHAFVAMVLTVVVTAIIIIAMLRWIEHLSDLGSVDNTLDRATSETREALIRLAQSPALGAAPFTDEVEVPPNVERIRALRSGYIQLIDVEGLRDTMTGGGNVFITKGPGTHVIEGQTIALTSDGQRGDSLRAFADCFVIGHRRSYEQDPLFGLTVLSEISSKALSPGVNDPGTSIEALMRLKTLIWDYAKADRPDISPAAPDVYMPVVDPAKLIDAAFAATARDGASIIEVGVALRQTLRSLSRIDDPVLQGEISALAGDAMRYAEAAGALPFELKRLAAITVPADDGTRYDGG